MARQIRIPPIGTATQPSNTVTDVSQFEKFTVYAAAGSVISLSGDGGSTFAAGTITMPAAAYITVTDLCTHVKVNAVHAIVGLFSHDVG